MMKLELSSAEKIWLAAIAVFPIAVFNAPIVDRLVALGLVKETGGWLEATEAGREAVEATAGEDGVEFGYPPARAPRGSSGASGAPPT